MKPLIGYLLRYRPLVLVALFAWLAGGFYIFLRLDIEAYPDPSPPLVEVITQNPAWSAEEMEQQTTVPIETTLNGMPRLQFVRSITIFGLSDVKLYFNYASDYFRDRQEVINRLQFISLPQGIVPQLSPWSPVGEIYRYRLEGANFTSNELKATEDWLVRRELKQVPGIIDVTTFGGTTKQYQAEVDPRKLLQFNVTLPQLLNAIASSNANAGGNYVTLGSQSVNVRGLGLLRNLDDMRNVAIAERNSVPVFLGDVAEVHEGFQPRLGRVGADEDDDVVEGIVLLQRGEQSLPALRRVRASVTALNHGLLPRGMRILTIYDRTDLVRLTTKTVGHIVLMGLVLVVAILLVFIGDFRISVLTALTIPCAVLFAFALMVSTGNAANLISIGAIDFGILADAAVIVIEYLVRRMRAGDGAPVFEVIAEATAEAARPVLFSVLVIITALIPLFTMRGVPGKIFAPMSITYGFALTGALIFALLVAPVLASWIGPPRRGSGQTRTVKWLGEIYARLLPYALAHRWLAVVIAGGVTLLTLALLPLLGGEFMPKLEEGNLWLRATLPLDVSFEYASSLADQIRRTLGSFPEVTQVVSQTGRPDDGTDVTTFNNIEFFAQLKPESEWPGHITKSQLIREMDGKLREYPGVAFNFSQNIQDNVEEAMSGVKGENSLKLFGDDIDVLAAKAAEIFDVMAGVAGVADLAVFRETGQPQLAISIDRAASARFGLLAADVNASVQAAIGGQAVTQILEGDRRFDFVVRYRPEFRQSLEAIRNILLPTPDGGRIPLGQVARVALRQGAFMIYRENGRRYIPIKFSVRGRDLAGTIGDIQTRLTRHVRLPEGYHYEWAGEYDSLRKEVRRLAIIIPVSLVVIFALLFMTFNSLPDALRVLATLPVGAGGGILALLLTGTPFSISAAVGFASVTGVETLGGVVLLSGIRRAQKKGITGNAGVEAGALGEMRAVLMAGAAAGLGLLPAAVSSGIGAQAQQPLARVVVGGMVTSVLTILFVLPVLATFCRKRAAGVAKQ